MKAEKKSKKWEETHRKIMKRHKKKPNQKKPQSTGRDTAKKKKKVGIFILVDTSVQNKWIFSSA